MDKFTNAITLYPAKGLKGNRNANFYEFLTMGQVPYLIGSGMLMSIFNSANKHFADATSKQKASPLGKHMVILRTCQKHVKTAYNNTNTSFDWC